MAIIDIGNTVRLSVPAYRNGEFVDKELFTLQIKTPDGVQQDIPGTDPLFVFNADTGRHVYSGFVTAQAGRTQYRFKMVDADEAAAKWNEFIVRGMLFTD